MKFDRSWIEIDLDNFRDNLTNLKQFLRPDVEIMQIVKADAYGHGSLQITQKALECGVTMLGVANTDEGVLLRYQGIRIPILILSPAFPEEIVSIIENDLTPTISTLEFAEELNRIAKGKALKVKVHIEVDTGMGRSGIELEKSLGLISKISDFTNLEIEGIFSHYAASENDPDFSALQLKRFEELIGKLDFSPRYLHIANSSGIVTLRDNICNLVRLGLLSYGIYSDPALKDRIDLKPVMTFKSRLSQVKSAGKGESIGYNRTYIAQKDIRYGIIPVGYADGYDFLLSNKGNVLIKNKIYPLIGKVSMDMTAVDISGDNEIYTGDEVILLGDAREELRAESVSELYKGSSYEILCQLGRRAKRFHLEKGKIKSASPLLRREFISLDYSDLKLNSIIESAIEQRLQSREIADLIYSQFLHRFFLEKDQKINYRSEFKHRLEFSLPVEKDMQGFYQVNTSLTFRKKLADDHFYVACAKNEELLEHYFLKRDVEYRWLLDSNFDLERGFFDVTDVRINDINLYNEIRVTGGCIEIRCHHPGLRDLVGQDVEFSISTRTFYPRDSHQISVYLIELTRGVKIDFSFGDIFKKVEAVPIFSGKNKFPEVVSEKGKITLAVDDEDWVFPNSGVVFVY